MEVQLWKCGGNSEVLSKCYPHHHHHHHHHRHCHRRHEDLVYSLAKRTLSFMHPLPLPMLELQFSVSASSQFELNEQIRETQSSFVASMLSQCPAALGGDLDWDWAWWEDLSLDQPRTLVSSFWVKNIWPQFRKIAFHNPLVPLDATCWVCRMSREALTIFRTNWRDSNFGLFSHFTTLWRDLERSCCGDGGSGGAHCVLIVHGSHLKPGPGVEHRSALYDQCHLFFNSLIIYLLVLTKM